MDRSGLTMGLGLAVALGFALATPTDAHGPGAGAPGQVHDWRPGTMQQGMTHPCMRSVMPHYGMMHPGYGSGPGYGPGTMQHGMGPGMMGPGMTQQGMGPDMIGRGEGAQGMGPGMMGRGEGAEGMGPGWMPHVLPDDLGADQVRHMMEHRLAWIGNPNLKIGTVEERDADTVVAEIVTQDGSLVQRFEVDRHSGWWQPAQDQ